MYKLINYLIKRLPEFLIPNDQQSEMALDINYVESVYNKLQRYVFKRI